MATLDTACLSPIEAQEFSERLRARNAKLRAALERALKDSPAHPGTCSVRFRNPKSPCDCWRKQAEEALK